VETRKISPSEPYFPPGLSIPGGGSRNTGVGWGEERGREAGANPPDAEECFGFWKGVDQVG
jgi:hypothetical protein